MIRSFGDAFSVSNKDVVLCKVIFSIRYVAHNIIVDCWLYSPVRPSVITEINCINGYKISFITLIALIFLELQKR